jgi:hypothetical protein
VSARSLVLLQTSDVLAGAPLVAPGVGWTPELREAVREERLGVLTRAVAAAREASADAILVPGDLWDADTVSVDEIQRLLDTLASFAPGPILLAPGARDAQGRLPFAERSVRAALGLGAWPENVHLLGGAGWSVSCLPGRADVAFAGRAYDAAPFPEVPPPPAPLSVLLASVPEGDPRVPREWTWGAFGGRHAAEVRDGDALRGAFAGSPVASSFGGEEPSFLLVRLAPGRAPAAERVPSSGLRFLDLAVDVDGLDEKGVLERTARRLEESGARVTDAVRVTLSGTPALGARLALAPLSPRVRHLAVIDRTIRPSPGESAGSAEARFSEEMRARVEAAGSPSASRVTRLAWELGRAALSGRSLAPPGRDDA